jgi:hypothetical protein
MVVQGELVWCRTVAMPCRPVVERKTTDTFFFSGELGRRRRLWAPRSLLALPSFFSSSPLLLAV